MQLKRKIAFALCFFYLASMLGVALSMHFCGGKLANVSVHVTKAGCKFCKGESVKQQKDGCCKNTKVDIKVKDDHQSSALQKLTKLFSVDLFLAPRTINWAVKPNLSFKSIFANKAPPIRGNVAIYLLHCVFRN